MLCLEEIIVTITPQYISPWNPLDPYIVDSFSLNTNKFI